MAGFDFNALMQDPQFQMGLGIFGAASPKHRSLLTAYQLMQQQKKQQMDAEEARQMSEYRRAQAEQAKERTKLYGQQVAGQEARLKQQAELMGIVRSYLPRQLQTPVPQQQLTQQQIAEPPVVEPPPVETGKYGTPKTILRNLMQVESSGNPLAIGPDIGGGVKALGAFQFLPSTIADLKKKGVTFNPFDPIQSEDAADFYIQELVKEHGDYPKALAAYGGFKTKDASTYVSKVLSGSPEKQAQQVQQLQAQSQLQQRNKQTFGDFEPSFQISDDGIKIDLKPRKPMVTKPGDIVDGVPTPDPAEQQRLANEQTRIRQEQQRIEQDRLRTAATVEEKNTKAKLAQATDFGQVQGVLDQSAALSSAAASLRQNPGLDNITGRYSVLPDQVRKMVDPEGMNAKADLDALGSKILLSTITALKALSQNGSTGFGQLSNIEGEHLINSVASLKTAQTTKQIKERLTTVIKSSNAVMDRAVAVFEQTYGKSVYEGLPIGTRPLRDENGEQRVSKRGLPLLVKPDGKLIEVQQ
jgi:soluble lytic murein transglycosylase-like protein